MCIEKAFAVKSCSYYFHVIDWCWIISGKDQTILGPKS